MVYIKNVKISPKRTKTGFLMWTFSYWKNSDGDWVQCYGPMSCALSDIYSQICSILKMREIVFVQD